MPGSPEAHQRANQARLGAIQNEALGRALALFEAPPHIDLATWIERELVLPASASAIPGPVRLWPHQRGIADAISDAAIWKIVVQKPARVGYTLTLGGVIGSFIANMPAPILVIVPTESDAKNFVTDTLESTFDASPALRGKLNDSKRNRLLYRQFPGGWLRVVAAKAPRNLRAHTAKVVIFDEIDAFDISAGGAGKGEGDPIALGIKRSDTFPDRKIILGGTPVDTDTSHVIREYENSDARVFEIPCPHCGVFFELLWGHIQWEEDKPETAHAQCPHCEGRIEEQEKAAVVSRGVWRITRPDVRGVAGFRLNALIAAGNPAAAWPKLAAEFLKAKRSPDTLKPFVNTVLGQGWDNLAGEGIDEHLLAKRAESFSLECIPKEVRILVAGVDVQGWGFECLTVGFTEDNGILVLEYRTLHGDPHGESVWEDLDVFIKQKFKHELGAAIGFDSVAVDSGDGNLTEKIYSFTRPRFGRRVIATKGHDGPRKLIDKSSKPGLYVIGTDTGKTRLFDLLSSEGAVRFSNSLPARFFEEITAERKVTKYKFGRPKIHWEKTTGQRNEALDCMVMALAVRNLVLLDSDRRENELRNLPTAPAQTVWRSKFMQGHRWDD